jgi:alanyl-tRNA synthetase
VRRIEALTGAGAEQWVDIQTGLLRDLAAVLGVPPAQMSEKIDALLGELKQRQRESEALRTRLERDILESLLQTAGQSGDVRYVAAQVEAPDSGRLRTMGDWLRDKLGSGVVVLGAAIDEKAQLLVMVTPDLHARGLHAGQIVKRLAPLVGGSGGGRPDMAQAGGRDLNGIAQAIAAVAGLVAEGKN